jgi:hypothetical protein
MASWRYAQHGGIHGPRSWDSWALESDAAAVLLAGSEAPVVALAATPAAAVMSMLSDTLCSAESG